MFLLIFLRKVFLLKLMITVVCLFYFILFTVVHIFPLSQKYNVAGNNEINRRETQKKNKIINLCLSFLFFFSLYSPFHFQPLQFPVLVQQGAPETRGGGLFFSFSYKNQVCTKRWFGMASHARHQRNTDNYLMPSNDKPKKKKKKKPHSVQLHYHTQTQNKKAKVMEQENRNLIT